MNNFKTMICAVFVTSCSPNIRSSELRLGDVVKFEFNDRNLFYSKVCSDNGSVVDKIEYEDLEYLVKIKCTLNDWQESRFIWIDKKDILDVIELAE